VVIANGGAVAARPGDYWWEVGLMGVRFDSAHYDALYVIAAALPAG
jgi:hypothetical protein